MDNRISRRGLFSAIPSILKGNSEFKSNSEDGEKVESNHLIRPPYVSADSDFEKCKKCEGYCIYKCEEKILYRYDDETVIVKFNTSGCTFCGECLKACYREVLNNNENARINAIIQIDTKKCLAWNKVMCFSCKDPCLDNAIKFEGLFNPIVITDKCTACGFCINACPMNAITAKGVPLK